MSIPDFDTIQAFTNTIIVSTNVVLDLVKLYEVLPVKEAVVTKIRHERTKRRRDHITFEDESGTEEGFVTVRRGYEDTDYRGTLVKRLKPFKHNLASIFRYAPLDATVNCKLCPNGVLQITGCKDTQIVPIVQSILVILASCIGSYEFSRLPVDRVEGYVVNVMRNIHFDLGFHLDRDKFSEFLVSKTPFYCLPDSLGNRGGNLKLEIEYEYALLPATLVSVGLPPSDTADIIIHSVCVNDYLRNLPEKIRQSKMKKKRYSTFMVFESGKIICSSVCAITARGPYEEYMNLLLNNRDAIEFKCLQ